MTCRYYAIIEEGKVFLMVLEDEVLGLSFTLYFQKGHHLLGNVTADLEGQIEVDEHLEGVAAKWMPVFHRNCWLSGCDIEATAHEKAEWMQGLTKEEVEAWNLKM